MLCTDFYSLVAKLWKLTRSLRSLVRFAKFCNSWIKIRTPHFLWSNLFILHGIIGELRCFSLIEMLTPFSFRQRHKLHAQSRAAPSSWVLSKFPNSMHRQLIAWTDFSIAKPQQLEAKTSFICDWPQNKFAYIARWRKYISYMPHQCCSPWNWPTSLWRHPLITSSPFNP